MLKLIHLVLEVHFKLWK